MADHVRAINYLCRLFDTMIGTCYLKPEHFRQCKLNTLNCEEVTHIKAVIHKLCCYPARSDSCNMTSEECVGHYLLTQGGAVSYQWSPQSSGRQLLLCLGYIVASGTIETIINQLILDSPLGHEVLLASDAAVLESDPPVRPVVDSDGTRKNYADVLITQIQRNLKAIANFRQERSQLCYKVHRATTGFRGLPHLSVGDLRLVNSPERVPQFVASCQPCLSAIKAYTRWQADSHLFWKWMDSVLKEEDLVDLKKCLTVHQLTHLSTFLIKLEKYVRDSVLEEKCIYEFDTNKYLSNMRISLTDDKNSLQGVIHVLDSKIETLSRENEKKKQELCHKLLNCEKISDSQAETLLNLVDSLVLRK